MLTLTATYRPLGDTTAVSAQGEFVAETYETAYDDAVAATPAGAQLLSVRVTR